MPLFEYKCDNCGGISEFLEGVGIANPKEKVCRFCGDDRLIKVFSTTNISSGDSFMGIQGGKTCCGRDGRCDVPPCSDDGVCKR